MKSLFIFVCGCVAATAAFGQQRGPSGIEAKIREKAGAWETVKVGMVK